MVDNAHNIKYMVPYMKILRSGLDQIPDVLTWNKFTGFGVPTEIMNPIIEGNVITLHGETCDTVKSDQVFNIDENHGATFQCHLPTYNHSVNEFGVCYFGFWDFGSYLFNNKIYLYVYDENLASYDYHEGDFYQVILDGIYANFYLNGILLEKSLIQDRSPQYAILGFFEFYPINEISTFTHVYAYQTGCVGQKGLDGNNCNTILSTYKNVTNVPTELVNYGSIGDYYLDKLTNKLYGPKLGLSGSVYFDKSVGTYLSVPNDIDFRLRQGDFTIEWFQYTTQAQNTRIFSINSLNTELSLSPSIAVSIEGSNDPQSFLLWINGGLHNMGQVLAFNKWTHFAVVRSNTGSGGLYKVYQDGISLGNTFTGTDDLNDTTHPLIIGGEQYPDGNTFYNGYITNFRWTKGVARYTQNFEPLLVPLVPTDGFTKLLLNFNTFTTFVNDSSGLNKTVTNHSAAWNVKVPFKSVGSWVEPLVVRDPPTSIVSLTPNGTTTLWDFSKGLNSIIIYIGFAASLETLTPSCLTVVAVNKSTTGVVSYLKYNESNLPTDVQFAVSGLLFNIRSTGDTIPAYSYISVKILAIN